MKQLLLDCSCGSALCHTTITVKEDNENKHNVMLSIKNAEISPDFWVSLSREDLVQLYRFLRSKYGRLE